MNFCKRFMIITLFIVNLLCFSRGIIPVNSFSYYPDSLFEEIRENSFNLTLTNGEHVLVIDNSGYAAGWKSTERQSSNIDYEIRLPLNCSPQPDHIIVGRVTLEPKDFYWVNFSLTIPADGTGVSLFTIEASNEVSVFVTDVDGLYEFWFEMVNAPTFPSGLVLLLSGLAIISVIIGMVVLRYRSQKLSQKLLQMPKPPLDNSQHISPHKAISTREFKDLDADQEQLKQNLALRYCVVCGKQLTDKRGFCAFCGTQQPDIQEKDQKNSHQMK